MCNYFPITTCMENKPCTICSLHFFGVKYLRAWNLLTLPWKFRMRFTPDNRNHMCVDIDFRRHASARFFPVIVIIAIACEHIYNLRLVIALYYPKRTARREIDTLANRMANNPDLLHPRLSIKNTQRNARTFLSGHVRNRIFIRSALVEIETQ